MRLIHLGAVPPPDVMRSIGGYSVGRWEQETLVVETTHLRADDPARSVTGRPLLLSRQSTITEWFTRVSPTELFYRFTIEDDELYTTPWSGEFSMTRHDGPIYEYACHEGNYSLPNILRGGQAEAARLAESNSTVTGEGVVRQRPAPVAPHRARQPDFRAGGRTDRRPFVVRFRADQRPPRGSKRSHEDTKARKYKNTKIRRRQADDNRPLS